MGVGILPPKEIKSQLLPASPSHHFLHRPSGKDFEFNTSSIDLPLGSEYWVMQGSCRTGTGLQVRDLIRHHAKQDSPQTLEADTTLEKKQVYLIKLDCSVSFKGSGIQGKATARSSIGRLDVLVRLLADGSNEFDRVPENASGDLYVEVAPITFDITVSPGTCLSQLRLFRGSEDLFTLSMEELEHEEPFPVVDAQGKPLKSRGPRRRELTYPFSLDLMKDKSSRCYGFVAKENPPQPINPDSKGPDGQGHYDPTDFWEPVSVGKEGDLHLHPDRLYILRSKERLRLPPHLAVECQAYTETLGEWRIEYAGFAHPFFGSTRDNGTPIIFEVRGHNIPTILRDGLQLGNVSFRRMSQPAKQPEDGTPQQQYEGQELKLSSCFKPWPQ